MLAISAPGTSGRCLVDADVGIRLGEGRILNVIATLGGVTVQPVVVAEQNRQIALVAPALSDELDRRAALLVVRQPQPDLSPILEEVLLKQRHDAIAERRSESFESQCPIVHACQPCYKSVTDAVVSVI